MCCFTVLLPVLSPVIAMLQCSIVSPAAVIPSIPPVRRRLAVCGDNRLPTLAPFSATLHRHLTGRIIRNYTSLDGENEKLFKTFCLNYRK